MCAGVGWALAICLAASTTGAAAEALNVRLLGYNDLQGRPALQVVLKDDFAYVGHHAGSAVNPITGRREPNGTSIVDVSDPSRPKIVHHLPGFAGSESRAVQVLHDFYGGRDFLLRNQEAAEFTGFEIWDITRRSRPLRVSTIAPLEAAHKSWWDAGTGLAYLSGTWPGWHGRHLIIYDLKNPNRPMFLANWGLPGQEAGAAVPARMGLHHPVVAGRRAYLSYLFGGDVVILDISQPRRPQMIAHMDFSPPYSGTHTTVPFLNLSVPGFSGGSGGARDFLVVSEEAFAANCRELRRQVHIVDATEETKPVRVAGFKVPDGDFCRRGGRFGPHQFAETRNGNLIGGTLLYIAYFNAGLRIVDMVDPYRPTEVGYYVPTAPGGGIVQTNDVDVDYRGYVYITDRAGAGLHVLEYTGKK